MATEILEGDCVEVMATMDADSFDAIVTDPPYNLSFMGRSWDRIDGESIDPAFLHWFAGFVDGEGCFSVHKKPQNTYDCQFSITLRADDRPILERIQRTLGMGTLSKPTAHHTGPDNPKARYSISSKAACLQLRDILRAFPLRAKKARDFEVWSEALDAWVDHRQGEWDEMGDARTRLMALREYAPEGVRVDPFQFWTWRWAREAFRILKPGAHILVMGGTRTYHRMVCGLEDAGFEVRDSIMWGSWLGGHVYASGFPKSHNLDGDWEGWGTALKPAWEPIVLARKPLRGTVAANVQRYGTGALNIDATRIGTSDNLNGGAYAKSTATNGVSGSMAGPLPNAIAREFEQPAGRWPPNLLLTDAELFDVRNDGVVGSGAVTSSSEWPTRERDGHNAFVLPEGTIHDAYLGGGYGDTGGYARFFLVPKASRSDREPVWGEETPVDAKLGLRHGGPGEPGKGSKEGYEYHPKPRANTHPTTKPVDLMRHLVRLVTPPGGRILDPFLGSGTTAIAAIMEGFECVGIEKEPEYVAIAEARLNGVQVGMGLTA